MVPFIVEHHLKADALSPQVDRSSPSGAALVFETCLRKILIHPWGENLAPRAGVEIFSGPDAYVFLLEVLSGLKSPVFGETEVFSQFKVFWENSQTDVPQSSFFTPWAKCLFEDVKKLRSEFFRSSTTQTWGGVVRKSLRPYSQVWILGNGELAASVAASLKDTEVTFWARQHKVQLKRSHHPANEMPLPRPTGDLRALVVCAPLTELEMAQLQQHKPTNFDYVMDLRDAACARPAFVDFNLQDIQSISEINQYRQQEIIERATERIQALTEKTWDLLWHRPSGWEDLCG